MTGMKRKPQRRVAIVGAGLSLFMRRALDTGKELAYYAASQAVKTAGIRLKDIQAVVMATAPDAFDGVSRKGEGLLDGAGGSGKTYGRAYGGGGSGVFSIISGWMMVASGLFDLVLVVAEEKMSSCQPHPQGAFLTIFDHIIERPLGPNLLWIFSLEQQRYMAAYGIQNEDIALVSVKNKHNALAHPAAQVAAQLTVKDVLDSEVVAWPVHRLMVSPISDGAAAVVLASEHVAQRLADHPIWIQGVGWCLDTSYWGNRDLAYPRYVEQAARMAYEMAGITEPRRQIHVAEPYDPFAYKELHHLKGLQLADRGKAPDDLACGRFDRGGGVPTRPAWGLVGVGNPIAAAGLMKICELFWQLPGAAGTREGGAKPQRGLPKAGGELMQLGTVAVLGVR